MIVKASDEMKETTIRTFLVTIKPFECAVIQIRLLINKTFAISISRLEDVPIEVKVHTMIKPILDNLKDDALGRVKTYLKNVL
jgi:hypothetical protein